MKKRILSIILVLALCLTLMPMTAFATGTEEVGGTGSGEWFGYCTEDIQYEDSIGVGGGKSLTFAIKIPVASLPNQDVLSKVSFHTYESGTYHVRIYSTDPSEADPGTAAPDYEQEFTVSNPKQWEDVVLTTPYEVDKTKDLWIGIEATDPVYPATHSTEILETTDCCMMYFQGTWYPITELGPFSIQPWMIRGYFETVTPVSGGKTLPYSFDFETDPFSQTNGWTTIDADGDGYDWKTDTDDLWDGEGISCVSGSHCVMSRSFISGVGPCNADNWLFSPAITIPEGGATVSWYEQSQDPDWLDSYTVYVGETAVAQAYNESTAPNGMKVLYAYHEAAESWTKISVELSAENYGGKTVYIAFRHQSEDYYILKIDNFAVGAVAPAHTYTVTNGTPESDKATNHGYIAIDKTSAAEDETVTLTVAPSAGYQLKAGSLKVNDGAVTITCKGIDKYEFTMPKEDVAVTAEFEQIVLPYFFDFESDFIAAGWTTIDADGDGYDWKTDTDALWDEEFGIDKGHCAISRSYENNVGERNANNWLFSPAITVPAGGAIVSWYEKSQDPDYPDSYTVYVGETTDLSDMTVICATHEAAGGPDSETETIETWTQKTVELSAEDYAGKTVYIAFRHLCYDQYILKIDNFAVEAVAPAHTHNPVLVNGQAATETAAGWSDYYECACGALFEDENATTPIDDLDTWKAEGGNGYIAPLAYTIGDILATVEDFPTTAENGWVNENGLKMYSDMNLAELTMFAPGKWNLVVPHAAEVAPSGNNYVYVLTGGMGYTVTFVMENNVLVKVVVSGSPMAIHDGTYAPEHSKSEWDECPYGETCPIEPFEDTLNDFWYHDGIHFCLDESIMHGFDDGTFRPNGNLTREQIVNMLWNMEGEPQVEHEMTFLDVANDRWSANAIRWAQSARIVFGHSDEEFAPADYVTREQLMSILHRYAEYKGKAGSLTDDLSKFTDTGNIHSWFKDDVRWAVGAGIVHGDAGMLDPLGNTTRAQAAVMIHNFCINCINILER